MKWKGKIDFDVTPQVQGVDVYDKKTNLAASAAPTATDDTAAGYAVGSRWIDTTNDKEYVCVDATATAAVWTETTGGGGGVFGSEYQTSENLTEQSTSSQSWIQRHKFTTTSVPAGDYVFFVNFMAKTNAANKSASARVQCDDTTTLLDSAELASTIGDVFIQVSGSYVVTLSAATHDFDVDVIGNGASTTTTIKDIRMEMWRVS